MARHPRRSRNPGRLKLSESRVYIPGGGTPTAGGYLGIVLDDITLTADATVTRVGVLSIQLDDISFSATAGAPLAAPGLSFKTAGANPPDFTATLSAPAFLAEGQLWELDYSTDDFATYVTKTCLVTLAMVSSTELVFQTGAMTGLTKFRVRYTDGGVTSLNSTPISYDYGGVASVEGLATGLLGIPTYPTSTGASTNGGMATGLVGIPTYAA